MTIEPSTPHEQPIAASRDQAPPDPAVPPGSPVPAVQLVVGWLLHEREQALWDDDREPYDQAVSLIEHLQREAKVNATAHDLERALRLVAEERDDLRAELAELTAKHAEFESEQSKVRPALLRALCLDADTDLGISLGRLAERTADDLLHFERERDEARSELIELKAEQESARAGLVGALALCDEDARELTFADLVGKVWEELNAANEGRAVAERDREAVQSAMRPKLEEAEKDRSAMREAVRNFHARDRELSETQRELDQLRTHVRRIREAAEAAGWNGIENSKTLWGFVAGLGEELAEERRKLASSEKERENLAAQCNAMHSRDVQAARNALRSAPTSEEPGSDPREARIRELEAELREERPAFAWTPIGSGPLPLDDRVVSVVCPKGGSPWITLGISGKATHFFQLPPFPTVLNLPPPGERSCDPCPCPESHPCREDPV